MKLTHKVKLQNSLGLHIRPATAIVKLLQPYEASVHFTYKKMTINARSIMSLLMLAAKKNAQILVTIDGSDAKITMDALLEGFANRFGEK